MQDSEERRKHRDGGLWKGWRHAINRVLAPRGLTIRRLHQYPDRHPHAMQLLKQHGVQPATVIDVGVGRKGTPWLYEAFPQAQLVLIDPNPALQRTMATLAGTWKATMISAAAGSANGTASMYVDETARSSSSLLTPVRTLDWIVEDIGAPHTQAVIAEASVAKRFNGSYEFADLVAFLDRDGVRLFDFVEVTTLGHDGPINYLDAVFVRRK